MAVRTLDNPGDGFASVLMMTVSISPRRGFVGLSKVPPLDLTDCRMGRDHIPRPPPMACSLRFERVGMSLCAFRHSLAGFGAHTAPVPAYLEEMETAQVAGPCGHHQLRDLAVLWIHSVSEGRYVSTTLLTPLRAIPNVMSEMGPWAGIESHRERCTTVRVLTESAAPFVVPFAVGLSASVAGP